MNSLANDADGVHKLICYFEFFVPCLFYQMPCHFFLVKTVAKRMI